MCLSLLKLLAVTLLSFCCFTNIHAATYQDHTAKTALSTEKNKHAKTTLPSSVTFNNLPAFSAVDISGPMKVILTGKQHKQSVTINFSTDLSTDLIKKNNIAMNIEVKNKTLFISPGNLNPRIIATIHINMTHTLTSISARGAAVIKANHLDNPNLDIIAQNSASIYLPHNRYIRLIQNNGAGNIVVSGINNKGVFVRNKGGNGKIILSGKTDELDVRLSNTMTLNAINLTAKRAHALTKDDAVAYVHIDDALFAFAYDKSNIYYYDTLPPRLVRDMRLSGNVMKLMPKGKVLVPMLPLEK